ncbi:hypothetical protein ZIOFF_055933 [Zingiber officinale]|uniref:Beta-glucosidase n=2 Tax=Zingiber officinale TaxID=94328 RepID=A0A8J5F5T4_ZINOF|nr:hypothetical protein ZIOFF_060062 [Zingiber officinale]KAG6487347.1 hypothetical protein ZIOFF_055933 [Zingiber officinale]
MIFISTHAQAPLYKRTSTCLAVLSLRCLLGMDFQRSPFCFFSFIVFFLLLSFESSQASNAGHGLSRESFPEGFVFGTAASAYQVEGMALKGGRGPSIWDAFVRIPNTIAGNATADVTVDEYHHYKVILSLVHFPPFFSQL